MKRILRLIGIVLMMHTVVEAAPARGGVRVFEQGDGSRFTGLLKGDASFHWIESNSQIVLFNPDDNFYYYAKVDADGKLKLTQTRVPASKKHASARSRESGGQKHSVSPSTHNALMQLLRESKKGNHPR